jgi:hypothetical protein
MELRVMLSEIGRKKKKVKKRLRGRASRGEQELLSLFLS